MLTLVVSTQERHGARGALYEPTYVGRFFDMSMLYERTIRRELQLNKIFILLGSKMVLIYI